MRSKREKAIKGVKNLVLAANKTIKWPRKGYPKRSGVYYKNNHAIFYYYDKEEKEPVIYNSNDCVDWLPGLPPDGFEMYHCYRPLMHMKYQISQDKDGLGLCVLHSYNIKYCFENKFSLEDTVEYCRNYKF